MEQKILDLLKQHNNKKKKSIIEDNRIWTQRCSTYPIDLQKVMDTQENTCNYAYSLLFSDNEDIKMNKPAYKRRKINKKKISHFLKNISPKTEDILNQVYTKIKSMKDENKELQKLNALSIQKTSKLFFRTNRPKTSNFYNTSRNRVKSSSNNFQTQTINIYNINKLKKNYFKKNNKFNNNKNICLDNKKYQQNTLPTNENTKDNLNEYTNKNSEIVSKKRNISSSYNTKSKKNKNNFLTLNKTKFTKRFPINFYEDKAEEKYRELINIDIPKLYKTNKKKDLNLARLNDEYRVQMNKSLRFFNPENHLKDLNKIQRDNISVRKSMEKVKYKMNEKINDRCQGQYYKKEYLRFKEEYEKDRKAKSLEKKPFPVHIPFNIIFRDDKKNIKVFPNGYKIRAYYDYCASCDRIQKSKDNDLFNFGLGLILGHIHDKDYDLMYDTLDELYNILEIEPIDKYIEKFKNEKLSKDRDILTDRIKNYFPVLTETEKKLEKMGKHQILKKKGINEQNDIISKIFETKKLLYNNEFDY